MTPKRGLLLLGLPVFAVLLLFGAAVTMRSEAPSPEVRRTKKSVAPTAQPPRQPTPELLRTPPKQTGTPDAVLRTADEARLRGTYDNYRTAVATGNAALRDSLEPVLRRESDLASKFAQEELAKAKTDNDREIARKTLAALRR